MFAEPKERASRRHRSHIKSFNFHHFISTSFINCNSLQEQVENETNDKNYFPGTNEKTKFFVRYFIRQMSRRSLQIYRAARFFASTTVRNFYLFFVVRKQISGQPFAHILQNKTRFGLRYGTNYFDCYFFLAFEKHCFLLTHWFLQGPVIFPQRAHSSWIHIMACTTKSVKSLSLSRNTDKVKNKFRQP